MSKVYTKNSTDRRQRLIKNSLF